jgi:hypothetical protein
MATRQLQLACKPCKAVPDSRYCKIRQRLIQSQCVPGKDASGSFGIIHHPSRRLFALRMVVIHLISSCAIRRLMYRRFNSVYNTRSGD